MRSLISLALLLSIPACVEDVGTDQVKAQIEEPPATEAPAPAPEAPKGTTLSVDKAQSSLRALGAKITATHPIDFPEYAASVTVDGDQVTAVSFKVEMASLFSDDDRLTRHLKNEDFFEVETYPHASFESTQVAAGTEEADFTHTVTGDLSIHGVTKRVTIPAKITMNETTVDALSEFVINRQDFGVTYPGRPDDLVQDNVRMTIHLVAPRS